MINSMTLGEKLRFLADRADDGKEFYISTFTNPYFFNTEGLILTKDDDGSFHPTAFKISTILEYSISLKKPIVFTEDEKVILRNLPNKYRWIARNESDKLYFYTIKPNRARGRWTCGVGDVINIEPFNHLFQCIRWSDTEPCEFRKYL